MDWEVVVSILALALVILGVGLLFGSATALILGKSWTVLERLVVGVAEFGALMILGGGEW